MSTKQRLSFLLGAVLGIAGGGCAQVEELLRDKEPAKLIFVSPTGPIHQKSPLSLQPRVLNAAGEHLPERPVSISAIPTDVLSVSGESVACLKSGDATVSFAGGGLSANATVQCRIVGKLVLTSESLRLIAGTDPEVIGVTVFDDAGTLMPDFPYTAESKAPSVVSVIPKGGGLKPSRMGKAEVVFTAGSAQSSVEVVVVERVKTDPLALGDGASTTYSLERGHYEVDVNVTGGGVTAKWVGEKCASHPEAQRLKTSCDINNAASLVIHNPTAFGFGSAAMGNLIMYRVP